MLLPRTFSDCLHTFKITKLFLIKIVFLPYEFGTSDWSYFGLAGYPLNPFHISPMTFLRVIQVLLNMLIQYIFPENMTRNILCSIDSPQTLLCSAGAFEWLRHIPLSARIEESERSAFCDRHSRTNLPFCDIHDCSWCTRVIHVNQIRVELLLAHLKLDQNLDVLILGDLDGRVGLGSRCETFHLRNQFTFFKILESIGRKRWELPWRQRGGLRSSLP